MFKSPCKFILGTCAQIPRYLDSNNKTKHVFLPPLFFSVNPYEEDPLVKYYTGLYYFKLKMNNYDTSQESGLIPDKNFSVSCEYVPNQFSQRPNPLREFRNHILNTSPPGVFQQIPLGVEEIMNYESIVMSFENSPITYSQIYSIVTKKCLERGINPENAILGLFSCQVRAPKYIKEYIPTISNLLQNPEEDVKKARVFTENEVRSTSRDNELYLSPTIIEYDTKFNDNETINWAALANVKYQGCGLNVLSFYNILEIPYAREKTVCLNIQGTSIFKIVDYINQFLEKYYNIFRPGFMILRMDIIRGVKMILDFMKETQQSGFAIIFKMYKKIYINDDKKDLDQIGHSVSFYKSKNGVIQFIDPQQKVREVLTNEQIYNTSLYGNILKEDYNKNFIDIIFTVSNVPFPPERPSESMTRFAELLDSRKNEGPYEILTRPENLHYGGRNILKTRGKKYKQTKKRINKKSKKTKKYNTMRKRANSKRKKYGGEPNGQDKLDEFEKLMIEIDKKNNIPTVLDSLTVVDL
jgi:hypothetical protein